LFKKTKKSENKKLASKHFIEDKPLKKLNEDRFQYNQVAEILYDLLNQNNFPIHIGLFAPWGSGKTSVIKLLEDIITADKPNGDNYIIKTISVWKFADDSPSLHRKIVREVQTELKVLDDEGISNETTKTESANGTGIFSILFFNKPYKFITISYVILISILYSLSLFIMTPIFNSIYTGIFSLSTIGIIIGGLKIFSGTFQRGNLVSVKSTPLAHGDQYEARFKASVEKFLERNDGKSLVLVFDDLDRLPPKQLLAALNTIKTFLHSKNCAFIIPCDKTVLRNGIKTAFEIKEIMGDESDDDNYISEFINKTFDYQIHLPILEQKNMKRYAKQLLLDQKITWIADYEISLDKVLGILVHSSIKTPRQVKTLLNSFSSNWELAKKRDKESGRKLLSDDPLAVAVFTVLQIDFPEYYLKLISDPYLINRIDGRNNELAAYLSRVDKCIPKSDPRPFIYFSNEKLNPATGKPQIIKTKDFLVNAQVAPFKSSFEELSEYDKEILLTSVISDFNDNPGIEVENCIKTLIEAETELSFISQMDLHNWDMLIRENLDILIDFPPSKVCELLKYLSYDNRTWNDYGLKIDVSRYHNDLLSLWIEQPNIVQMLNIPGLASELENSFIESFDGYSLASAIYDVQSDNSIVMNINWLLIIKESLSTNVEPDYSLASWLIEWSRKTNEMINASQITEFLKIYNYRTEKFTDGIGQLWCEVFINIDKDLSEIIQLMDHESFSGFTEDDFGKINTFMGNANYEVIRDVVRPLLDQWWADGNYKKATNYLEIFTKSPAIPGFCEKNFDFDLDEETFELFLKVIINRAPSIQNNFKNIVNTLITEVERATALQEKSRAGSVIRRLLQSSNLRKSLIGKRESFIPINDKLLWFKWSEPVVKERLEMFFDLWSDEETAITWIFDCVDSFSNIASGFITSGLPYNSNASRYLSIFVDKLIGFYHDRDWEMIVDKWQMISAQDNTSKKINLFSLLDSSTRTPLLGQLSRRCQLGFENYNQLLINYYDASISIHREALFSRWEVIGNENRRVRLEELSQNIQSDISKESIKLLETHIKNNPLIEYLNEIVEWSLESSIRRNLIIILIDKLSIETVADWVNVALDQMNSEGFHKWKAFAFESAISSKKINIRNIEDVVEVALGLRNDRAKLALQLLLESNYNKNDVKRFRERIIDLHQEFPELVDRFGFRFKVKV
jgi:hypothetical protein